MAIEIFYVSGSPFSWRVLLTAETKGIAYQPKLLSLSKHEHRTPEFLAINPAGLVPVLITPEGEALYEAAALMVYLADRHQLTDLAPAVTDPLRGLFLSSVFWIASDIKAEMKRFHFPHRYSLRTEDTFAVQDMSRELVLSRLAIMNTRLAKSGPYILGSRFSLADFYLSFCIAYLDREAACKRFPEVARLYHLVRSRPRAAAYIEDTEKAADAYADMVRKNPKGVIA